MKAIWKEAVAVCFSVDLLYVSERSKSGLGKPVSGQRLETGARRYEAEMPGTRSSHDTAHEYINCSKMIIAYGKTYLYLLYL
jgi:hypothetical protein